MNFEPSRNTRVIMKRLFTTLVFLINTQLHGYSPLVKNADASFGDVKLLHQLRASKGDENLWQQEPSGGVNVEMRLPFFHPDFKLRTLFQGYKQSESTVVKAGSTLLELDYIAYQYGDRRFEPFFNVVYPSESSFTYGFWGVRMPVHITKSSPVGEWRASSRVSAYSLYMVNRSVDERTVVQAVPDEDVFEFVIPETAYSSPSSFLSYGMEIGWKPSFAPSVFMSSHAFLWKGWLPRRVESGATSYQIEERALVGSKFQLALSSELTFESQARLFWDGFFADGKSSKVPRAESRISLVAQLF